MAELVQRHHQASFSGRTPEARRWAAQARRQPCQEEREGRLAADTSRFQAAAKEDASEKKQPFPGKWRNSRNETHDQTKGRRGRSAKEGEQPRCFSPRNVTQGAGLSQKEPGARVAASPTRRPRTNASKARPKTFQSLTEVQAEKRGRKRDGQFQCRTVGSARRPDAREYFHREGSNGEARPTVTRRVAAERTPRTEEAAECR